MRLCFLAAANSIHSYRWVKFFAQHGHEVTWISLAPSIFEPIPGVQYTEYLVSGSPLALFRAAWKVRRLICRWRPDILHVHYVGTYGLVGILSGFHPVVMTAWGSDVLLGRKSLIKKPLVTKILKTADLVTCDADHMRGAMTELGVDPGKIRVVYFGIDTKHFAPCERNAENRTRLELHDEPTVISLLNLEPIYDIETLIGAAAAVVKQVPDARFVIVGRGSQEQSLRQLADRLGVCDYIRFVGFVPNRELPAYLSSMDIYVSTSLSDAGIAASTAEAMACGVPVVVTDTGANGKWIVNGDSGFLVPSRSPDRLAEKIVLLLKDSGLRARLGEKGRSVIQERNDYETEMSKMSALYASLLNRA